MSWEPELEELRRREELARRMGGEERVARQRASGRLNVRERIDRFLDTGSLHETGALAGSATYGDARHGDGSRLNLRYAWPSGDWGSLPVEGGIEAAYRRRGHHRPARHPAAAVRLGRQSPRDRAPRAAGRPQGTRPAAVSTA